MKNEISMKAAVYLRAAELVEKGHCKGALARNPAGDGVSEDAEDAVAWCLVGAVHRAVRELGAEMPNYWYSFHTAGGCPADWNNRPDTTAAMVAQKLREQAFAGD